MRHFSLIVDRFSPLCGKIVAPKELRASVGSRMSGSWFNATTSAFFWACAGSAANMNPMQRVVSAITARRMSMGTASIVGWLTVGALDREAADIIHLLRWARKGGHHDRHAAAAGGGGESGGGHRAAGRGARACRGAGALHRCARSEGG